MFRFALFWKYCYNTVTTVVATVATVPTLVDIVERPVSKKVSNK